MEHYKRICWVYVLISLIPLLAGAHFKTTKDSPIHITDNHQLIYKISENGDRVPDYSYCGYKASEEAIPNIPVLVIVSPIQGDATEHIQNAIDYVSSLPIQDNGFRGTVLLEKGTYEVQGGLHIKTSGVVLRGEGCYENGTILIGAGTDRQTLIRIEGVGTQQLGSFLELEDAYFPVNSIVLKTKEGHSFKTGDHIIVKRPSTEEWLHYIGADNIGKYVDYPLTHWEPGDFDINWERTILDVSPKSITLDAPITNSLDPEFGGGMVAKLTSNGKVENVGIENLRCVSTYDTANLKDENHRWMAVTFENVRDAWVRRVTVKNFVSSAVAVWETASRITVEDCKSLEPIGEIGNYRRYNFQTLGQQVLFQRCYAEYGYHAFSVGFSTPGPNAFVQCYSYLPYNFSGAVGGWANGILMDNMSIDGGNIGLGWRDVDGQGAGWSAANSLCWGSRVAKILLGAPPTAMNWAYASWAQGFGKGHHELQHTFVQPKSIYYAQLEARTGKKSIESDKIFHYKSNETTAPGPELSALNSKRSQTPELTIYQWIDSIIVRYPIVSDISMAKKSENIVLQKELKIPKPTKSISVQNGFITENNSIISGKIRRTSMWRGSTRPSQLQRPNPNLVRYVPGRTGRGLTDDLDTLVQDMQQSNTFAMQHFPALWYERRRDDHARYRRADADVWAPFYEQPFSRSGQGEAYDRLSKYDLNSWNTWYWLRLKQYADMADAKGLIFIHEHFLQHNIIEEGAHWADYPWRSANNINHTGFAEPVHYAGDKRVYFAEEFYDTTHVVRKNLMKNYIRKCLDESKDNTNTIHHLGYEFTGPVAFVQFWLDVIDEWQNENNRDVLVMLPGTKDVQEMILNDPKRSKVVDIIDIITWQYRNDGSLYAPIGGQSLAIRQYARIIDRGETSFHQVYRSVNELRKAFPGKAVVDSRRSRPIFNWAVFMAGGSFTDLPEINNDRFLKDAANFEVMDSREGNYILGKKNAGYIIYSFTNELDVDLSNDNQVFAYAWINPDTGEIQTSKEELKGGQQHKLVSPFKVGSVLWIYKHDK